MTLSEAAFQSRPLAIAKRAEGIAMDGHDSRFPMNTACVAHFAYAIAILGICTGLEYPAAGQSSSGVRVSLSQLGGICDGSRENAAKDTAALALALNRSAGLTIEVPSGVCVIDNSASQITAANFSGTIEGIGENSELAFTNLDHDGLVFTTPTDLTIQHLTIKYIPKATNRATTGYPVNVQTGTHLRFVNLTLDNGPVSALRVASSMDVYYKDITIRNFMANGIFSINVQNVHLEGVRSSNNGDAPVEFSYYDSQYSAYAVPCRDIVAKGIRSRDDVHGIIVNGCTNVDVSDFILESTQHDAVEIIQDPKTNAATWPDNVSLSDGIISNTGYSLGKQNQPFIQAITIGTSAVPNGPQHVSFTNVTVNRPGGECLRLNDHETVNLTLTAFHCYSPGMHGSLADITGRLIAGLDLNGNVVRLASVDVTGAAGPSFYFNSSRSLYAKGITSTNPNQHVDGLPINSAIYVKTSGLVHVEGFKIVDTGTGTGRSAVTDAATSGDHSFSGQSIEVRGTWAGFVNHNNSARFTH